MVTTKGRQAKAEEEGIGIPETDIQTLIAPAIQRVMSQSGVFSAQDPREEAQGATEAQAQDRAGILADQIAEEFTAVLMQVQESFTSAQTRLIELVRSEVRKALGDALNNVLGDAISKVEQHLGAALAQAAADEPASQPEMTADDSADEVEQSIDDGQPTEEEAAESHAGQEESLSQAFGEPMEQAQAYEETQPQAYQEDQTQSDDQGHEAQAQGNVPVMEESAPAPEAALDPEEIFEGVVKLLVDSDRCVKQVVHFVNNVSQKPELRLLRLEGANQEEGVEIMLGLTEPLPLVKILLEIEGVEAVTAASEATASDHRSLSVLLKPDDQE